jgi:hypothetical protein
MGQDNLMSFSRHTWILPAVLSCLCTPAPGQDPGDGGSGQTMKFRITRRPGQDGPADAPGVAVKGPAFAPDPEGAPWTLQIGNGGEVIILHDGVEVVRSGFDFAAQEGAKVPGQFAIAERSRQQVQLKGAVDALGLQWRGSAVPQSPRELRIELDIVASKPLSGIGGGGLTWTLKTSANVLRGKAGAPELLADQTGWKWPVAQGREIEVRFDKPIARLFVDADLKGQLRTSFVGDRIRAGRGRIGLTVTLPEGGRIIATDRERYTRPDRSWFRDTLQWDVAPVDLSFLNAEDRPAGSHGIVRAEGDRLVFADGTPARFWGANLSGGVLFATPRENIPRQARRMARLGYNLMRIHQQDANWVNPNVFGKDARDSRHLDPRSLDSLDLWIKCLKDEGIYVWLDMHFLRELKPADGVTLGLSEIARQKHLFWGFNYVNPELMNLMKEFQHQYLNHVNRYTGVAYKNDPAVIGVLITNENDLLSHFGVAFLPDKHNPVHKELYDRRMADFARATGLPGDRLWRSWEPGPAKYLLSDVERQFFRSMIDDLRSTGLKAPIATTSVWGNPSLYVLPSLTEGDAIDAHMYGSSEALSTNPHDTANFLCSAAAAQVLGKPVTITEWNVPYPEIDRFTTPLYVASVASLQGWDAPMLYNYSQVPLVPPGTTEWSRRVDKWSTFNDPAITGVMPAAALAFRRGHISPARKTFCLTLPAEQFFGTELTPGTAAALRTLVEQSRLTIGMPAAKELPWLKPSEPSGDVIVVSDPHQDFLAEDQPEVRSDTGELTRNWRQGVQTIDTPRTQAVSGWIGGKTFRLKNATFLIQTRKAVVALSSIDDQPLGSSRFVLITAVAQSRPSSPPNHGQNVPDDLPFVSEPVIGTIQIRNPTSGLELLALGADGRVVGRTTPSSQQDALNIRLPASHGTHWYVLRTRQTPQAPTERGTSVAPGR